MTMVDSSLQTEALEDTTAGTPVDNGILDDIERLDDAYHLSQPNRATSQQTQFERYNGGSDLVEMDLHQPILELPALPRPREQFDVQQKWEGYVLDVGEDTFSARLVRIIGEGPDLAAEIDLEEVDPQDRALLQPGATFYWSIGFLKKPSGHYRASLIRFRRLPPLTKPELEAAREKAAQLMTLFDDA